MRVPALFAVALLLAPPSGAQSVELVPIKRTGVISSSAGISNLIATDINGDGTDEIVSCSRGTPFILSQAGDSLGTTWMGPNVGCKRVLVADIDGNQTDKIVVLTDWLLRAKGEVVVLDPRSIGPPIDRYSLPREEDQPVDFAIGDVDSDGRAEVVVLVQGGGAVYVIDAVTHKLEWTVLGYEGERVRLGDVDGDSVTDILISRDHFGTSTTTVFVLDAINQTEKLRYRWTNRGRMTVSDTDGDGKDEILLAPFFSPELTVLSADTLAESKVTCTSSYGIGALTLADANGDGAVEVVCGGTDTPGSVEGRRLDDGELLWTIDNPSISGVDAITVGDVDGDGQPEVIWGTGVGSSAPDVLYVGDARLRTTTWKSADVSGPLRTAIGDVDGDSRLEWFLGSANPGVLEMVDVKTGARKAERVGRAVLSLIAQIDPDPTLEVVTLAGSYLRVMDGSTLQDKYVESCCGRALANADIDGDSVDEVLVSQLGAVVALGGPAYSIRATFPIADTVEDLVVVDLGDDGVLDLVVATRSEVIVINMSTGDVAGRIGKSAATPIAAIGGSPGAVASLGVDGLYVHRGKSLAAGWHCSASQLAFSGSTTLNAISSLAFVDFGDHTRLFAGNGVGELRILPTAGTTCPRLAVTKLSTGSLDHISAINSAGGSRPALLIDEGYSSTLISIGLDGDVAGDVDGDGVLSSDDAVQLVDFLLGDSVGISAAADVNGDGRISVEDAFQLIRFHTSAKVGTVP